MNHDTKNNKVPQVSLRNKGDFPGAVVVKNLPANTGNARDVDSIPGLGRFPRRRKWQPTPVFLPGKSQEQRSLAGYSPWGHKESDPTEQLSTHMHTHTSSAGYF